VITRAILVLVLLVSLAHALVHTYEVALPSVEQQIAEHYFPEDPVRGKAINGWMASTWRIPLGFGALAAGWLVDRFGARRMLGVYLTGCGAMSLLVGFALPLPTLFMVMFCMGSFACIYHPAGLALISREIPVAYRGRAFGFHGVFGSAGVATAPFVAGFVLSLCRWFEIPDGWQVVYLVLAVPGLLLGTVFFYLHVTHRRQQRERGEHETNATGENDDDEEDSASWPSFFVLTGIAAMMGFIYSGVVSFLPRYLDQLPQDLAQAGISLHGLPQEGLRNYLAGGILLIGCVSQYWGGRIARQRLLEIQFAAICFAAAPCLVWMSLASGVTSVLATATFALIHFAHQPIYNCLIAKYTPKHRRSLAYGFSFAMGLGVGSLGAVFAGYQQSNAVIYQVLAGVGVTSGLISLVLWRMHRANPPSEPNAD
jgi:MFS family permease